MRALRVTLCASGALFALSLIVPWNGAHTAWTILARPGDPLDRVPALLLVVAALVCLSVGFLRVSPWTRAIVAALVGLAGIAVWYFVDPPRLVSTWTPGWRLLALVGALLVIPAALLAMRRIAATVGIVALVAVYALPVRDGEPLVTKLLDALSRTHRLTWPQTATLVWILALFGAALAAILVWLPRRSQRVPQVIAWVFIAWTPLLLALADVISLAHIGGRIPPIALLVPLQLLAYGALSAYGLAQIDRQWTAARSSTP